MNGKKYFRRLSLAVLLLSTLFWSNCDQQKVEDCKKSVTTCEAEKSSCQKEVDALKKEIADLQRQFDSAQPALDKLNAEMKTQRDLLDGAVNSCKPFAKSIQESQPKVQKALGR